MISADFPWLSAAIVLPLVAAFGIPLLPPTAAIVRKYALGVALLELGLILFPFTQYFDVANPSYQLVETYAWVPQLNLSWAVAADGISMPLIVLTGFVNAVAIWAAWGVTKKPRLFFGLVLVLLAAQIGVFAARDLLMFFLMWELELIPVYMLIAIWGGAKRQYAATKFILYTALASVFILVAAFAMAFYGDTVTFDMAAIVQKDFPFTFELLVYASLIIAFGVKLPIFPLHTWLPDAHGEASAPISMILAGVLLKMGGYALIRTNVEMLPAAHLYFAPILMVLGVVNIVYGALNAFGQENLKRRLACSSISHMGFVLIGIASLTDLGLNGAVLQMISHGLIAAMLFFLAGVTYERTHTLDMTKMGGLAQSMPKTFAMFTAGSMASLALPGMSGFVGELMVFLGVANSNIYSSSFKAGVIVLAAIGLILTPIYLLSMLRRMFFGNGDSGSVVVDPWQDIKPRELAIAACLLVPIFGIGFYPKLATQTYDVKTIALSDRVTHEVTVVANARRQHPAVEYADAKIAPSLPSLPSIFSTIDR
ncbi:MAG: NAD(P)H-quinone oxidoreductase subunit 4 [Cyanobacteria bacterium J06597_1]